jgi:thioesterase domain-containing protein
VVSVQVEFEADEVADALRRVWTAALPGQPFALETRWCDLGVDSLKAMEIVLRLERRLGRRIGFDGLTPDASVGEFLATVRRQPALPDPGTRLFLLPHLFGDHPVLARLRRGLEPDVLAQRVELPDVDSPARTLRDLRATASVCADSIQASSPSGDLRIAGYSFGALAAQETAAQLEARGRRVTLLVILDGLLRPPGWWDPGGSAPAPASVAPASVMHPRVRGLARMLWPTLRRLNAAEAARRVFVATAPLHDRMWGERQRRRFLMGLRGLAVARWQPTPVAARTLLVTSDDFHRHASVAEWRAACPALRVVHIGGPHVDLLRPPAIDGVFGAIREALAAPPEAAW